MANLRLLFPNRVDAATLSGGSWTAGLPLANLKNRTLARVARTTGLSAANTQFTLTLDRSRNINAVVLINHNLSTEATFRVQAASDAGFTSMLYDSGAADAFPPLFHTADLDWTAPNWWSGRPTEDEISTATTTAIHVLPATVNARYWRVLISDATNADGYVQIGRVFLSGQWVPEVNYEYGAKLAFEDPSTVERSLGGTPFFDKRRSWRVMTFNFPHLTEASAFPALFDIFQKAGTTEEVFVIPDSDDSLNLQRRSFLGRMREMGSLEQAMYGVLSVPFALEEII